jgi:hypothetical protein
MNPRSALLVALLAAGFAYQPGGPASASRTNKTESASSAGGTVVYNQTLEVEDWPRETLHQFFSTLVDAKREAREPKCPLPNSTPTDFVVATVPDPENSRYPYMFDRFVESINRAAEEEGYTRDRFWLPWDAEVGSQDPNWLRREHLKDWRKRRQRYPGILVFRSSEEPMKVLGVLLVGENPVSGINKEQFAHALGLIAHFKGTPVKEVKVLGPTFSGSVTSLRTAMSTLGPKVGVDRFRVVSGSATARCIQKTLESDAESPKIEFSRTIENDDAAKAQFFSYLNTIGVRLKQVAILTESGTAYGSNFARNTRADQHPIKVTGCNDGDETGDPQDTDQPLTLKYPMEISRLRNAYAEDSEIAALSNNGNGSPQQGLPISLKALPGSGDSIPSFSTAMSPVSQETALLTTLAIISRSRVEYVGIVASDILDTIFLARMLKQHCPDVRLFMFNSDMVYADIAQNHIFEGMLMVTSYPLFAINQNWTGSWRRGMAVNLFPETTTEGIYNACRRLLDNDNPSTALADYAPPWWDPPGIELRSYQNGEQWKVSRPALWLTVVGRDGLWPVTTLHPKDGMESSVSAVMQPMSANNLQDSTLRALPRSWILGLCLITLICSLFAWWTYRFNRARGGHPGVGHRFLSIFETGRYLRARLLLTGACGVLLIASGLVAAAQISYSTLNAAAGWSAQLLKACSILTPALLLAAATWCWRKTRYYWTACGAAAICLFAFLVACFALPLPQRFFPLVYRAVHVGSGVSPIVPALFLLSAFLWYAVMHLNRIRLRRAMPLNLLSLGGDALRDNMRQECRSLIVTLSHRWFGRASWAALLVLVLTILLWLSTRRQMDSVEQVPFAQFYLVALFALHGTLLFACARILCAWSHLSTILRMLEHSPITKAFKRLGREKELSPGAVWRWGGGRVTDVTLPYALERLKTLAEQRVTRPLDEWHHFDYEKKLEDLEHNAQQLIAAGFSRQPLERKALARVRRIMFDVSNHLISSVLTASKRGRTRQIYRQHRSPQREQVTVAVASSVALPLITAAPPLEADNAAEDFVALGFVALIRYVNLHLKNLLEFAGGALILAIISLVSYPFEPHHMTAITTCFCVMSGVFLLMFMQMNRSTIISHLNGTKPGKLNPNLWHLAQFGGLPLLAVVSAQFPSIGGFLFAWVKPALENLR